MSIRAKFRGDVDLRVGDVGRFGKSIFFRVVEVEGSWFTVVNHGRLHSAWLRVVWHWQVAKHRTKRFFDRLVDRALEAGFHAMPPPR